MADVLIHQTFFCQMLEKSQFTKLSSYTVHMSLSDIARCRPTRDLFPTINVPGPPITCLARVMWFYSELDKKANTSPHSRKVWRGETLANWFFLSLWQKKVWRINRSANRLFIVSTNLDGFSLANHGWFAKLSPYQPFPLYGTCLAILASLQHIVNLLINTLQLTRPLSAYEICLNTMAHKVHI